MALRRNLKIYKLFVNGVLREKGPMSEIVHLSGCTPANLYKSVRDGRSVKKGSDEIRLEEMEPPVFEYALYKGEDLLGVGSVEEISRTTGKSEELLNYYRSTAAQKRQRKGIKRLLMVPLTEEEWWKH